jgi:hypothetical protein
MVTRARVFFACVRACVSLLLLVLKCLFMLACLDKLISFCLILFDDTSRTSMTTHMTTLVRSQPWTPRLSMIDQSNQTLYPNQARRIPLCPCGFAFICIVVSESPPSFQLVFSPFFRPLKTRFFIIGLHITPELHGLTPILIVRMLRWCRTSGRRSMWTMTKRRTKRLTTNLRCVMA